MKIENSENYECPEDVGGDIANMDFAERERETSSTTHVKHLHNPDKRRMNELAASIRDLRKKKRQIEAELKELTTEAIGILDKNNKEQMYTEDFLVSMSCRISTKVDRDYLRRHYPAAYKKVVSSGAISTTIYVKEL